MSWPPGQGTSAYIQKGSLPTTIAWGTDGILAGTIVKNVRSSRMIEEVKIENGTGLTSAQILLYDGDQVEITVVDDRNITFPDSEGVITLVNPLNGNGTISSTETYQIINNDYNAARKQEGERVILAKRYTLFKAATGPALPSLIDVAGP